MKLSSKNDRKHLREVEKEGFMTGCANGTEVWRVKRKSYAAKCKKNGFWRGGKRNVA